MKPIVAAFLVFLVALLFVGSTHAQQNTVVVTFKVTEKGAAPADVSHWGLYAPPEGDVSAVQLTDADGDGVFTDSVDIAHGSTLGIAIVQVRGDQQTPPSEFPGTPSFFGFITVSEDMLFELGVTNGMVDEEPRATPSVVKTFELILDGDVPSGESFGVEYNRPPEGMPLPFCGPQAVVACTGNGTRYAQTATVPLGFNLEYRYFRGEARSPSFEPFAEGSEVIDTHMTNSASYTVGGDGTQDTPSHLPDTGADSMVDLAIVGLGVVGGMLLLACGWRLRKVDQPLRS